MTLAKRSVLAEVQIAIVTLTRLPVGSVAKPVPSIAAARWAFPLVGVLVGAIVGAVAGAAGLLGLPPLVGGFLAVAAGLFATGALHEDGLADCADGFWGGRDPDRRLDIMRDSRIGTYGTLALILSVALRAIAIAALAVPFWSIVAVAILSRYAMVVALERLPAARPDGLGATAAERGSRGHSASLTAAAALLIIALTIGLGALAVALVMALATWLVMRTALRKIGGQTGDVLGATQQIAEISGLVAVSALAF